MHVFRITRLTLVLALLCPVAAAAQTRTAAPGATAPTVRREDWQRAPDIFTALRATTGSRIADLGAGEGWLTRRLAKHVGPSGRVFAVDISAEALGRLGETIKDSLSNVELILAEDDDPRLPFGTLDGVVIVNAYHEMTKRVPVLDGVKRSLKPGGLLVIVDNAPPADSVLTRKAQTDRHMLALDFVRDDLEAQGFEIVSTDPKFIDRKVTDHMQLQWLLVARRGDK